ncbi:hypothetical protein ASU33_09445 [Solirubrum puertoriconensis]|uniref:Uncharacterized protein n=1 Tax=Solirubrum puertoriconensis TaxID=1751427 RepID=A0A9X0HM79_SOLP1|nr:hypothetical protein ASU33_09445 [Solirubrum puertoriconensis]
MYFSWTNVEGWMSYSLGISHESFCQALERYEPSSAYWQRCLSQCLTTFSVYGLKEETWFEEGTEGKKSVTYFNEPHLVVLTFGEHQVGIANWYAEDDFVPRLPIGDDVWILFEPAEIERHIKGLSLDKLEA